MINTGPDTVEFGIQEWSEQKWSVAIETSPAESSENKEIQVAESPTLDVRPKSITILVQS